MTRYRTPYTHTAIPRNINDGSAIPPTNWEDPAFVKAITSPGIARRIDAAVHSGDITAEQATGLIVSLRLMRRHLNGDRSAPGEVLGRSDLPHLPLPFAPREMECATPGTPMYRNMRAAVERWTADDITEGLQAKFRENDPSNSTWARSAPPAERAAAAREDNAPASLRDTIEAAASAHTEN